MVETMSTKRLGLVRSLMDEARGDRLAIDVILATVGGDDLPTAIQRVEDTLEAIPERKEGRRRENRIWNDLVVRVREMLELALYDLKKLEIACGE